MTCQSAFKVGSLLLAVLLSAQFSRAQVATTQPDARSPFLYKTLNDDDKVQFMAWVNGHMPNLAKLIKATGENKNGFRRNRLLNAAATRYHNFQQAKDEPGVLEMLMKNVRLEDEIFGLIGQLDTVSPDQRSQLIDQIRNKTRAMIDQFLADRSDHLAKLRAKLDAEQRSLVDDRRRVEALVDQRLAHFYVVDSPATAPAADTPDPSTSGPSP